MTSEPAASGDEPFEGDEHHVAAGQPTFTAVAQYATLTP
jgi:hypothetical protein